MPRSVLAGLVTLGFLVLAAPLQAQTAPDSIKVHEAWSRATPGGAKVGAGYLVVENAGAAPDRLVGAEAEVAGRVEIHETTESGGVSRMRPVEAVAAAPGARITFRPGGHHLMLVELKRPLKQGERFAGALLFERAGRVPVTFEVRGLGAGAGHGAHTAH
jgi:periplasmic copper chaperone A